MHPMEGESFGGFPVFGITQSATEIWYVKVFYCLQVSKNFLKAQLWNNEEIPQTHEN